MPIKGTAKLTEKKNISEKIILFTFEMIEPNEMNFEPGQYVAIEIAQDKKRQYSICSNPLKTNKTFQIVIDTTPAGEGTQYLMALNIGSEISFLGGIGNFILPEEIAPNLFFIATGTGISPLKSIIDSIVLNREDLDLNIYLYYGTRTQSEILFRDDFNAYVKSKHVDIYDIYLSREENVSGTKKGYVGDFINTVDKSLFPDAQFFICGNGDMIKTVEESLLQSGVNSSQIFYEKFY